ncbi:alpha/beta fold hydrolase [Candidatus Xianfuyuplasma coldseepsis]|uniref:Alpha/beta hydrolase n=1 Tax=Candidatus Xianfuyuplasma coldseepsis TaxID=2782163 RepID=A0A7L7KTM0_9MOLU|nr:alpha/beta hydrolase [Xianfuyuplasma coldseepsis]QMS85975.1 alpha/beta hydrolase [Xianfuyuplasma coldseepsis]
MKKKAITLKNEEQYYYIDTEKGDQIIVLLHGNMSSSIHYKPLIERFKGQYRVIAPDMRGFGDSSYKKPIDSLHDLADDVLDFLRILGVKKYHLAGWSTGGAIAMSMAIKAPNQIDKLILIESCSYRGYPIFKKNDQFQPIVGDYYQSKEDMATDPVQIAPMVQAFETNNVAMMNAVWDQAIYTVNKPSKEDNDLYLSETMKQRNLVDIDWGLMTFNLSNFSNGVTLGDGTIHQIDCPVLSFWSEQDMVVLEYMVDETVEALQNVKKITLENSGHSPLVDCPDKLAKQIIHFIQ